MSLSCWLIANANRDAKKTGAFNLPDFDPCLPGGQVGTVVLRAAVWAAVQACFIRAGVANEVQKQASEAQYPTGMNDS